MKAWIECDGNCVGVGSFSEWIAILMLLTVSIIGVVTFLLLLGTFNSSALSLNRKWLHPMLWSLVLGGWVVMQHLCFWDQGLVGFSLWTLTRYSLWCLSLILFFFFFFLMFVFSYCFSYLYNTQFTMLVCLLLC